MSGKVVLAIAAAALSVGLTMASASAADKPTVRLAVQSRDLASFCLISRIAIQGDQPRYAFKNDGIDLRVIQLSVSQTPVAVGTGHVDMGDCAGISVVTQAWKKGARDVVIVAAGAVKPAYVLVAGKTIKRMQDLKGGTVASPGPQSTATEAVYLILDRGAKMKPGRDYTFVSAGTGAARTAALIAGRVSAISTYAPFNYELIDQGFNQIGDEMDFVPKYVSGCMLVNRPWAKAHSDIVVRMLKTMVQIGQWLKNPANKDAVIAWLAEHYRIAGKPLGKAYATRFYNDVVADGRVAFDGYADAEAIRSNLGIMHERGFLQTKDYPPLDRMVDYSYLNKALKALGRPPVKTFGTH